MSHFHKVGQRRRTERNEEERVRGPALARDVNREVLALSRRTREVERVRGGGREVGGRGEDREHGGEDAGGRGLGRHRRRRGQWSRDGGLELHRSRTRTV